MTGKNEYINRISHRNEAHTELIAPRPTGQHRVCPSLTPQASQTNQRTNEEHLLEQQILRWGSDL